MELRNTQGQSCWTQILCGLCLVMVIGTVVLGLPSTTDPDVVLSSPQDTRKNLARTITWYAKRYRIDPALLRAVIVTESNFNPAAVSQSGAAGLMQLMPRTAAALNVHDPFNPIENVRAGAQQLRYLLTRFKGNVRLALAAYHAGEERVLYYGEIPPIKETRDYVRTVLRYYDAFQPHRLRLSARRPEVRKLGDRAKSPRDYSSNNVGNAFPDTDGLTSKKAH